METKAAVDFRRLSLGEILAYVGLITQEQLAQASKSCDPAQKNMGQVLIALGFASEEQILKAVSLRLGIPYFRTFEGMLEPDAGKVLPETVARKHLAVPIFRSEDSLTIGMVNPTDLAAIDEIAGLTGLQIRTVMTTLSNLFTGIQLVYGARPAAIPRTRTAPEDLNKAASLQAEEISVVEAVNVLLQEGATRKASDIHLEAAEKLVRARFRVDGMLQEGRTFPKEMESALIARIKILAKLDITEVRLPQDGHLRFVYGGKAFDVRVSTLPLVDGEKAVLRLLDPSKGIKKLPDLGMSAPVLKSFSAALRRPTGLILVTGPTGSGKTTTLYSAVAELNEPTRNIVTLENPVEYRIDRVNQVETSPKIGLTFAAGLRSILRQDPNVILMGEIRDEETAEIAIQAAITGHLVLSTLHANDAVSTFSRLINMRIEPFLIATALEGIMAQRLLRRLCERCRREQGLTPGDREALGPGLAERVRGARFYEAVGCESCFSTGYSGRFAVHEWLPLTRSLRELAMKRASVDEIRALAREAGLVGLQESALASASRGETSLAEVIRMTREAAD